MIPRDNHKIMNYYLARLAGMRRHEAHDDAGIAATLKRAIAFGWAAEDADKSWPTIRKDHEHNRKSGVSASEFKTCPRQLALEKRSDFAPNGAIEETWCGVAARGHLVEDWIVDALLAGLPDHFHFWGHSWMQRTLVVKVHRAGTPDKVLTISGTPDAILDVYENGVLVARIVLEFKSVDPRSNLYSAGFPREKHVAQVQLNAALLSKLAHEDQSDFEWPIAPIGATWEETADKTSCVIIYVDTNDLCRIRVCEGDTVPFDRKIAKEVLNDAVDVCEAVFHSDPDPALVVATGHFLGQCQFCGFTAICPHGPTAAEQQKSRWSPPAPTPEVVHVAPATHESVVNFFKRKPKP